MSTCAAQCLPCMQTQSGHNGSAPAVPQLALLWPRGGGGGGGGGYEAFGTAVCNLWWVFCVCQGHIAWCVIDSVIIDVVVMIAAMIVSIATVVIIVAVTFAVVECPLVMRLVVGSILDGGHIDLFLAPASAPRLV